MIKQLEVHETTSGKLSSVEIKSHSGLENQLEDTIGQALKELAVKEVRTARMWKKMSLLFTKMAMEMSTLGLHRQLRRKGGETTDNKRPGSPR